MSKLTTEQVAVLKKANLSGKEVKRKRLSEDEFAAIKMMKGVLPSKQVEQIFGRSPATVSRVFRYESLEELKERAPYKTKTKSPKKVALETKKNEAPESTVEQSLERIAAGIERLADAWEKTPQKRKIF